MPELKPSTTFDAEAAEQACDVLGDGLIDALGKPEPPGVLPPVDEDMARTVLDMAQQLLADDSGTLRKQDAAGRWLRAGLAGARLLGDPKHEGALLFTMGVWHYAHDLPQQAIAYFESALANAEDMGYRIGMALALNRMGVVYHEIEQYEKALTIFQRMLSVLEDADSDQQAWVATALLNIASAYEATERTEKAIEYYQRAASVTQAARDWGRLVSSLAHIGAVHLSAGRPRQAWKYLRRARTFARKAKDQGKLAVILNGMGAVHLAFRHPGRALGKFKRALTIAEEVGDQTGIATTLHNAGGAYQSLWLPERALEHFERARTVASEIGATDLFAASTVSLAWVLRGSPAPNRRAEAVRLLEETVELMEREGVDKTSDGTSLRMLKRWLAEWNSE